MNITPLGTDINGTYYVKCGKIMINDDWLLNVGD